MYSFSKDEWIIYGILRTFKGKKAAKEYQRKQKQFKSKVQEYPWKTCFGHDEGYTEKRFFPWKFTDEEWKDLISVVEINVYSPYDCTGKLFTADLSKYETKDGTWVYHRLSMDV